MNEPVERPLSKAMRDAKVTPSRAWEVLGAFMEDQDTRVRSSAVRAAELVLKGSGELGADMSVTVDARTALLPAGFALDAPFEALAAQLIVAAQQPETLETSDNSVETTATQAPQQIPPARPRGRQKPATS